MLWWRFCKKPKERTRRKLYNLSTAELAYDNNKPKKWVRDQLNAAIADLRRVRHNAQESRDRFLDDEIDAGLLRQDMSRVKMLEKIKKYEEDKTSFNKLERVLKKPPQKKHSS